MSKSMRSERMLVKAPPTTYILITKKKSKKLADATLTKWSRFASALIQISIIRHSTKKLACIFKNANARKKRKSKELYEIKGH